MIENYKYSDNVDYRSEASCAQDVVFCEKLTDEMGFNKTKPTILWEDNNGCMD